jgi:uncharacterized membrane protein
MLELIRAKGRPEHVVLAVVLAAGLAARLYQADYNFDGDEVFSVTLASQSFTEVIRESLQDRPHPPLHNVLLHLWIQAFGPAEVSARALSVVFSVAFLLTSYFLMRRLMAPWLAVGCVAILAFSPLFVYYGQQARPYALIAVLSAANLLAFLNVLEQPGRQRQLVAWAVSCAVLLYAQYLGALVIGAELAVALLFLKSNRLRVMVYGVASVLPIVPWFLASMGGTVLQGDDPLTLIAWMKPPTLHDFLWFYVSIFGAPPAIQSRWLLVLLAILAISYVRQAAITKKLTAEHALMLLLAIGLPTAVFVVSAWGPKPIFASRQMLGAAIAFVAATGLCLATLPVKVSAVFMVVLLTWTAASLPEAFPQHQKPPWRSVATHLDEHYGSLPIVVEEGWVKFPLEHYRKAGPVRFWNELSEDERQGELLLVIRPSETSAADAAERDARPHRTPLSKWHWGAGLELQIVRQPSGRDTAPAPTGDAATKR